MIFLGSQNRIFGMFRLFIAATSSNHVILKDLQKKSKSTKAAMKPSKSLVPSRYLNNQQINWRLSLTGFRTFYL